MDEHRGGEFLRGGGRPLYGHEPLRFQGKAGHVSAVRPMDGYAPASGDVPHDPVPRQGVAAVAEMDRHARISCYDDAVGGFWPALGGGLMGRGRR